MEPISVGRESSVVTRSCDWVCEGYDASRHQDHMLLIPHRLSLGRKKKTTKSIHLRKPLLFMTKMFPMLYHKMIRIVSGNASLSKKKKRIRKLL